MSADNQTSLTPQGPNSLSELQRAGTETYDRLLGYFATHLSESFIAYNIGQGLLPYPQLLQRPLEMQVWGKFTAAALLDANPRFPYTESQQTNEEGWVRRTAREAVRMAAEVTTVPRNQSLSQQLYQEALGEAAKLDLPNTTDIQIITDTLGQQLAQLPLDAKKIIVALGKLVRKDITDIPEEIKDILGNIFHR